MERVCGVNNLFTLILKTGYMWLHSVCLEFIIDVSERIGMHLKWNQSLIGAFSSVNTCHMPGPEMG